MPPLPMGARTWNGPSTSPSGVPWSSLRAWKRVSRPALTRWLATTSGSSRCSGGTPRSDCCSCSRSSRPLRSTVLRKSSTAGIVLLPLAARLLGVLGPGLRPVALGRLPAAATAPAARLGPLGRRLLLGLGVLRLVPAARLGPRLLLVRLGGRGPPRPFRRLGLGAAAEGDRLEVRVLGGLRLARPPLGGRGRGRRGRRRLHAVLAPAAALAPGAAPPRLLLARLLPDRRPAGLLHLRAEARHHVRPAALVGVQLEQPLLLGVLQQLAEGAVAVVRLVERRLLALHRVLDHRRPEHVLVLAAQGQHRLQQQGEGLALGLGQLGVQRRRQRGGL